MTSAGAVVVATQGAGALAACLESLARQSVHLQTVVVVAPRTAELDVGIPEVARRRWPGLVRIAADGSAIARRNTALRRLTDLEPALARLAVVDEDVTVSAEWFGRIERALATGDRRGAAGGRILLPNGRTVVHAGGYVERPRLDLRPFAHACGDSREVLHATRDVEYVSSRAMVLDSRAIREIDLFDERFELSPYADVDLCARLRAGGWTVVSAGEASAVWSDPILPRERLDQRRALHRDRLLFAIRTTSTAAARHTFLQGEATNAGADLPTTERRALLLAYLDVQLALPDTIHASRRPGESGGLDGWMDVLAQAAAAIHAST